MKIAAIAAVLAFTALTAQARAQTANPLDGQFAAMASVGNTFEIASSRMALKQATQPELVAFARMMISDHGRAQSKLDAAAAAAGADAGRMLDSAHQQMLDNLSTLSGAEFDDAYAKAQVLAHQESEQMLSDYVATGEDPSLHRYAQQTLPIVEMHMRRIQALAPM